MERLSKYISKRGFCSRREAERLILEGRVTVNNIQVKEVVTFVTDEDKIEVNNTVIKRIKDTPKIWTYYKPRGYITTRNDPDGRPTIYDNLPEKYSSLITIGRLDMDSEGLLLLTNNGDLARYLELPKNKFLRTYRVKAFGNFDESTLDIIRKGTTVNGINYLPAEISLIKRNSANSWFEVTLQEGKNREIRKVFASIGLIVNRLIRLKFGPYDIEEMLVGEIKERLIPLDILLEYDNISTA